MCISVFDTHKHTKNTDTSKEMHTKTCNDTNTHTNLHRGTLKVSLCMCSCVSVLCFCVFCACICVYRCFKCIWVFVCFSMYLYVLVCVSALCIFVALQCVCVHVFVDQCMSNFICFSVIVELSNLNFLSFLFEPPKLYEASWSFLDDQPNV